jgi:aspartokinase-like uncharacterized kinase
MKVVKFGGSCLDIIRDIGAVIDLKDTLIVPGGGAFADNIRTFSTNTFITDEAAHKMAIYAMNQYGLYLSMCLNIPCIESISENVTGILLPYNLLNVHDPFPYSWEVTSDSIAIFVSHLVHKKTLRLIKRNTTIVKEQEKLREISSEELKNIVQDVVDNYFITCMEKYQIDCELYNANNLQNFKDAWNKGAYDIKITCR